MGQEFHCAVSSVNVSEAGWSCHTSTQTNLTACPCIVFEGWLAKAIEVTVSCCVFCLGYHFVSENSSTDPVWFCQPLAGCFMESVALCITWVAVV